MPELRDRLRDAVESTAPRWSSAADVRRASQRRRTRSRLAAGLVALAVAIAGVAVTLDALSGVDGADRMQPAASLDASALERAWSADLVPSDHPLGGSDPIVLDASAVYVADGRGVSAFPKACSDPCAPLWYAEMAGTVGEGPAIAVGDGVLFASTPTSLMAFDVSCSTDGSACAPLWQAELPRGASRFAGLLASGRTARVVYGLGGNENANGTAAAIYEADACDASAPCEPVATAQLGPGTIYSPGTVVDGVFYQQVGTTLTGILPASCAAVCEPVFAIDAADAGADPDTQESAFLGPVAFGDSIVVTLGIGEMQAYAPACAPACTPLWVGPLGTFVDQAPLVSGDTVVTVAGDRVVAFESGCAVDGRSCRPVWTGELDDYGWLMGDDSGVVVVDHAAREGRITAFGPDCRGTCSPAWTVEPAAETSPRAVENGYTFVTVEGELRAYPMGCSTPCAPAWTQEIDGSLGSVAADDTGLYVRVGGNDPDLPAQLVAYQPGAGTTAPDVQPTEKPDDPEVIAQPSPTLGNAPLNETTSVVQVSVKDVDIASPIGWTLVQLHDPDPGGSTPILQLTNFHVALDASLCPSELAMPPDGVALFVERTTGVEPASVPQWPVEPEIAAAPTGDCADPVPIRWAIGDDTFAARLLAGADASPSDRERMVQTFRELSFGSYEDEPARGEPEVDEVFSEPAYVTGFAPNPFDTRHTVFVFDDGDPTTVRLGWRLLGGGIGSTTFEPDAGQLFLFAGDAGTPITDDAGAFAVTALAYVAPSVERVVLVAEDGRRIEAAVGPSMARYGAEWRPVYVEFEAPLVGTWELIQRDGSVLGTPRYANWPA